MTQQTLPQLESRLTAVVQRATAAIKESRANTELIRRLNTKLQEQFEDEVTAALVPMFEAQIKSAAERLRVLGDERKVWLEGKTTQPALGLRLTSEGITSQIFDPREWNEELINRTLPVIANGMSKAMRLQLRVMGIDTSSLKQMADRSMIKAFCPTGPGGGIDNSCGSGGGSGGWKPSMSRADAEAWASDSEWQGAMYHATSHHLVGSIKKEGFRTGAGTMGVGIYLTPNDDAGRAATGITGDVKVLETRVRVKKVLDIDLSSGGPADWEKQPAYNEWVRLEGGGSGGEAGRQRLVDAGYDAVRVRFGQMGDYRLVLKKESVVIVDESTKSTKSTASEWLESYEDIGETLFDTPMGQFNIVHATEYPEWMKQAIEDRLRESFAQDYWAKVNLTTLGDIDNFLITGLREGWSIARMAKEMAPNLLQEGAYATRRGKLIARTEMGNSLNGARSAAMDSLINELGEQLPMKKTWLSVLGTTTRDEHANLDGVPADKDGMWELAGIRVRWPGDVTLPPSQRCNCMCSLIIKYGMTDAEATTLLGEYQSRLAEQGKSLLMTMQVVKGGPSSGNFGHMGNPPYVGGSGKGLAAAVDNEGNYIPGNIGKTLGLDTSKWKKEHPTAQKALARIHKIEKLIFEEKWDELKAIQKTKDWFTSTAKTQNAYSKATLDAQAKAQGLLSKKLQGIPKDEQPISAPAPASIKPTKPANVIDPSKWNKIGGQLGTEKGGLYENPETGKKYYVKTPDDPNRARNEVLAAKLYELAGADVPGIHLTEMDGKLAVASEWNDNLQNANWSGNYHKQLAHTDFAVHAWLNNRDAVGAGSENPMDNIRFDPSGDGGTGKMVTVDVGGSLDYKGMGGSGKKEFQPNANEWDTLRDPNTNPTMAKVFGEMTPYELKHSASKLTKVTDEDINALVDKYGNGGPMEKNLMKSTLKSRRDNIIDKANGLNTPMEPSVLQKPSSAGSAKPPTTAPKPAAPTKNTAVPPPPKAKPIQYKLNKIYDAAQSGDVNAVMKSVKTKATNTSPYLKKLHDYKMSVIDSMKSGGQANPAHKAPPVAPQKIKIDPSAFPAKPSFTSSNKANVAANDAAATQALGLAKNGDITGLKSMDLPPSPKLKAWHDSLVSQLHVQLNPPPPPKAISATYLEATKGIGNAKTAATIKKIGYWHEIADLGGVPEGLPTGTWQAGKWVQGKKTWDSLPASDKETLKSYTGGASGTYNSILRDANTSSHTYQRTASAAKKLITHGDDITPGQNLKRFHYLDNNEISMLKVGQVVSDRGMLSTSARESWSWPGNVEWRMTVGHGVKGSYAKQYSNHKGEDEVILPPNQRMMITKVDVQPYGAGAVVYATVLPTEDSQCCPP